MVKNEYVKCLTIILGGGVKIQEPHIEFFFFLRAQMLLGLQNLTFFSEKSIAKLVSSPNQHDMAGTDKHFVLEVR